MFHLSSIFAKYRKGNWCVRVRPKCLVEYCRENDQREARSSRRQTARNFTSLHVTTHWAASCLGETKDLQEVLHLCSKANYFWPKQAWMHSRKLSVNLERKAKHTRAPFSFTAIVKWCKCIWSRLWFRLSLNTSFAQFPHHKCHVPLMRHIPL